MLEGFQLDPHDILQPDPMHPTLVGKILAFMDAAWYFYAVQTAADTLSAVAHWHTRKSLARLQSPTHHPLASTAMTGLRN